MKHDHFTDERIDDIRIERALLGWGDGSTAFKRDYKRKSRAVTGRRLTPT